MSQFKNLICKFLTNKYFYLFSLIFIVVCLYLFIEYRKQPAYTSNHKIIAITQIVEHDSLDRVRQGIIDGLNKKTQGHQIQIVYKNAQGNLALATQIAQQFVASKPNLIIAIATPSAQAVASAIKHSKIPLVFASITDPVGAKLVNNLQHPEKNITGTRNITPLDKELELIKAFIPNVKIIGLIINESEINSVQLVKQLQLLSKEKNLRLKVFAVTSSAEVHLATSQLAPNVDAIFLLQDNTVASALPALLKVAKQYNTPVFSSYLDAVKKGALAGLAFDEYSIGLQTADMAIEILHGGNPNTISVADPSDIELAVNVETASDLSINISPSMMKKAKYVYSSKEQL